MTMRYTASPNLRMANVRLSHGRQMRATQEGVHAEGRASGCARRFTMLKYHPNESCAAVGPLLRSPEGVRSSVTVAPAVLAAGEVCGAQAAVEVLMPSW